MNPTTDVSSTQFADPVLPPTAMHDDRSVRQAGIVAGIAGLVGMVCLTVLFLDGDSLASLITRHQLIGLPLALLLLATVGGYGMLSFYGFRLRSAWARRLHPDAKRMRHDPGRLAMTDLRKIRWYGAATMLAILACYLVPANTPEFLEVDSSSSVWWSSATATKLAVLTWTLGAAAVVLMSRRAAWDIAAASGRLSGPDDVRAFQVLMPMVAIATQSDGAARPAPIAAIPMSQTDSAFSPPSGEAVLTSIERIAAAESLNSRRDWEFVLMSLLVVLLLGAVGIADATRSLRKAFIRPGVWTDVYENPHVRYEVDPRYTWRNSTPPPSPPTTRKSEFSSRRAIAILALLSELVITALAIAAILWCIICLMNGAKWRRPASLLLLLGVIAALYNGWAFSYLGVTSSSHVAWLLDNNTTIQLNSTDARYAIALLPLALLVLITRPAVRSLFDLRVPKPGGPRR